MTWLPVTLSVYFHSFGFLWTFEKQFAFYYVTERIMPIRQQRCEWGSFRQPAEDEANRLLGFVAFVFFSQKGSCLGRHFH